MRLGQSTVRIHTIDIYEEEQRDKKKKKKWKEKVEGMKSEGWCVLSRRCLDVICNAGRPNDATGRDGIRMRAASGQADSRSKAPRRRNRPGSGLSSPRASCRVASRLARDRSLCKIAKD